MPGKPDGRRGRRTRGGASQSAPRLAGVEGGRYSPLDPPQIEEIDRTARQLLSEVGLSDAPSVAVDLVTARGGAVTDDLRLTIPDPLIAEALDGFRRAVILHGQVRGHELDLRGTRVHTGTGGAAPSVVDLETGRYRDATLADLYDAARLADRLSNIHFFSRSLVARDMRDTRSLDLNTAYASLAGTAKHVMTSVSEPGHLNDIAEMCFLIAGSADAFRKRPFLSLNINHVTPPLRFAPEAVEILVEAVRLGIPVHCNAFGQLGASSPVTIAGCLAQTVAETLAGMIVAWLANPEAAAIFGARPMITDLRTGAMSGGGGEQALLMAASTQMARHYGLPNSCIAGATDAKAPDAQSGFEKALSVSLAAQAGSNLITQACGMQAGLMGVAFEGYVIDNDMLGAVLRSLSPIAVDPETLSPAEIGAVARGEGHFLGQAQTLARMESDFLYPEIADRRSPDEWEAAGAPDIRASARGRAREILADHRPTHIGSETDAALRARFDIRLPATG
ncbi:MAG: trimethylamine methyltransferase family protein [Paracoccaceae bacterium]|nr:trimethylamine methyltransferase family protein [Paracoccaceae bacterium]